MFTFISPSGVNECQLSKDPGELSRGLSPPRGKGPGGAPADWDLGSLCAEATGQRGGRCSQVESCGLRVLTAGACLEGSSLVFTTWAFSRDLSSQSPGAGVKERVRNRNFQSLGGVEGPESSAATVGCGGRGWGRRLAALGCRLPLMGPWPAFKNPPGHLGHSDCSRGSFPPPSAPWVACVLGGCRGSTARLCRPVRGLGRPERGPHRGQSGKMSSD